ncbi:MAG: hypothetical protein KY460_12105 [Actinobacteria bacterium]|nr:hypothetical protein [Actinomycetota bacterium]
MTARRRPGRRSVEDLLTDIHEALADAEGFVLPLAIDDFMADRKARGLARDVLNRIRTAVIALDRKALGPMPEFVHDEIAGLRNLAVYDYGMEADEFVYRTLRNAVPKWRVGIDRVRYGSDADGELPTTVPNRRDGSLERSRPMPRCGHPMPRAGKPCVQPKGHTGAHRSTLP